MLKKFFLVVFVSFFSISFLYSQDYLTKTTPQRIILNLTASPATSIAVTWRTTVEVKEPQVAFAESEDGAGFYKKATRIPAKTEKVALDLVDTSLCAYYHSAILENLKPNTLYAYRVGAGNDWSEWSHFTTAENKVAPFKFVYLGDPQDYIKEHVSRIFRKAFKSAPDASFWLCTGDLTADPEDELFEELYYAADFIFRTVPTIFAPGNHDCKYKVEDGKFVITKKGWKERLKEVSQLWRGQFTFPENGVPGLEETCYYIDYQGVRIIMLDSNHKLEEQAEWMEKKLSDNPNRWTIVAFHHPLYSLGGRRDDQRTRNAFLPLFDKYSVDLVLTGHDHVYARSHTLKNGEKVKEGEKGTVYVLSVSGPKAYPVSDLHTELMAKTGGQIQLFQVLTVDGGKLGYKAYTVTGRLYDSFELSK